MKNKAIKEETVSKGQLKKKGAFSHVIPLSKTQKEMFSLDFTTAT